MSLEIKGISLPPDLQTSIPHPSRTKKWGDVREGHVNAIL
jgi:hypothetical protein